MQGKGFLWEPKVIENLTREGKVTITKARLQFIINLNETTLERHHDEKRGRERETKDKRKEISKNLTADSRNDERVKDVDSRNNMSTSLSAFSNKWKYLTRSRHKLTWKEFLKTFFVNKSVAWFSIISVRNFMKCSFCLLVSAKTPLMGCLWQLQTFCRVIVLVVFFFVQGPPSCLTPD